MISCDACMTAEAIKKTKKIEDRDTNIKLQSQSLVYYICPNDLCKRKAPFYMLSRSKAPKTQQITGCKRTKKPVDLFDDTKGVLF